MKNLLSKERLLIREAAVHWDDSIIGMLSKVITSPLSWLKGSIKKGIRRQQVNNLIVQWGMEYVKAIKNVDLPEEGSSTDDQTDNTQSTDGTQSTELTAEDRARYIESLNSSFEILKKIKQTISPMRSWRFLDTQGEAYSKIYQTLSNITFDASDLASVLKVVKINEDISKLGEYISTINSFISTIKKSENVREFTLNIRDIQNFQLTIKKIMSVIPILEDIYELTIRELQGDTEEELLEEPVQESMIFEASEYSLPGKIEDLFNADMLEEIKQVDGIKLKTRKTINIVRLNTIRYEANYVIEKAGKSEKADNQAKLKKIWEQGILNTNDYFQDVIDVDYVMEHATGNVDAKTTETIQQQQGTIDQVIQLGLSEILQIGTKFDVKAIYAFQGVLRGQNGKSSSQVLFMSPTDDFTEQTNGSKYFVFKLLGSYRYNRKTKLIERFNTFAGLTSNAKMMNNFNNIENNYYVMMSSLRPGTMTDMFIYSNTGKYFFKQDIVPDVANVADSIRKFKQNTLALTLKQLGPVSNVFRFKINQRFIVDSNEILNKRYPGVQLSDGTTDKDVVTAKTNHVKLMNIIGDV